MRKVLWPSVLGCLLVASVSHAGHGHHHRGGGGADKSHGEPRRICRRSAADLAECRDLQREVQAAVVALGDAATHRHQVTKTVQRVLRQARIDGRESCRNCIVEKFARGVVVGDQRPCGLHDPCVTGARLDPASDTCVASVCESKKGCCRARWTGSCAEAAAKVCKHGCEACPHDECVEGRALAAECSGCSTLVCQRDPYCCDTFWDDACVEATAALCGVSCATSTTSTTTSTTMPATTSTTITTTSTTTSTTSSTTSPECVTAADCGDQNPCTDDACTGSGQCTHVENADPCEDGDPCTVSDRCESGRCTSGAPRVCSDNNACTSDFCDISGTCRSANNINGCDDGNPCTIGDRCFAGGCVGGALLDCNDNDRCTVDFCDSSGTCAHSTPGCSDGNACTLDFCDPATGCGHQMTSCDDGDVCTIDTCDTTFGCDHLRVSECAQ